MPMELQANQESLKFWSERQRSGYSVQMTDIFNETSLEFCADLSLALLRNPHSKRYPDLITFAYFIRKSSLRRYKDAYLADGKLRVGWGQAVHITPSNIPINAAYSFIFGLLSGNSNLIKLPSKNFPQLEIFVQEYKKLASNEKYENIKRFNHFFQAGYNNEFLLEQMKNADARVVWGGDATVKRIRLIPMKEKCIELAFPDRSSLCILNSEVVGNLSDYELDELCQKFYNDTLLVDQNACSSPSIIVWLDPQQNYNCINRFWEKFEQIEVRKGPLGVSKYVDKLVKVGRILTASNVLPLDLKEYGLGTTVNQVDRASDIEDDLRIGLGFYRELKVESLERVHQILSARTQTITYFGVVPEDIVATVVRHRILGVDRVVPVGEALALSFVWDGKDIIRNLSRIVSVS